MSSGAYSPYSLTASSAAISNVSISRVTSLESGFGFGLGLGLGLGLRVDQSRDLAARVLDGLAGLATERVREGFEARAEGVDAEVEDLLACEGGELLHDWQSSLVWGKIQGVTGRYREIQGDTEKGGKLLHDWQSGMV